MLSSIRWVAASNNHCQTGKVNPDLQVVGKTKQQHANGVQGSRFLEKFSQKDLLYL
jgi:hypothetical protein